MKNLADFSSVRLLKQRLMVRQKNSIDDKYWTEVNTINNYAIFMGYLLMGVRGLGLLVLTWTTVVLLGGFVSMLQKDDFWCLTTITLVQTAGVVDFLSKEKASGIGAFLFGLLLAVFAAFPRPLKKDKEITGAWMTRSFLLALFLFVVQISFFSIVLCPLVVLYMFGLYLSAGISLWRLIQHNYGNADGGANLNTALNVLYSLAMTQGAVYGYRAIFYLMARTRLVEVVAHEYSLETDLVSDYLDETMRGCMKDPLSIRGRNLVTYAVDLLMESKSRYGYISGVLILGRVTVNKKEWSGHSLGQLGLILGRVTVNKKEWSGHSLGQPGLIKQLLTGSSSFNHIMQRLAETFGRTNQYSTEIRLRAARIVANVAGSIRLDQFPHGMMIECISSLLEDEVDGRYWPQVPKKYERDWLRKEEEVWYDYRERVDKTPSATAAGSNIQEIDYGYRLYGYKELVVQGLRILQKLAANEDNCRVMVNTQGLLSKTMAHLTSDKLHEDHHEEWSIIAVESLEFMNQLMATLGLGGTQTTKLTSEISSNSQAIIRTLGCHKCHMLLKRKAAQVLLHLSPDTLPSIVFPEASGSSSNIILVWMMLEILLLPDYHGVDRISMHCDYISRLAGEKMQAMLSTTTEARMLPSVVGDVIGSLARTVAGAENNAYRIHAAIILEHLCRHYTKDDENLKKLKKVMTYVVMPEVLKEIVLGSMTEEIQAVTEANNCSKVLLDLEQGGSSHDNNIQESSSTRHQQKGEQHQGIQLHEALTDLYKVIEDAWIGPFGEDKDLAPQFNEIAAKICLEQGMSGYTLVSLLREAPKKRR